MLTPRNGSTADILFQFLVRSWFRLNPFFCPQKAMTELQAGHKHASKAEVLEKEVSRLSTGLQARALDVLLPSTFHAALAATRE
jgi:hypothetical protein